MKKRGKEKATGKIELKLILGYFLKSPKFVNSYDFYNSIKI